MMKSKKPNKSPDFMSIHQEALKNSIKKINLSFIWIIIADMIFYLASGYLVIFWLQRVQDKIQSFNLPSNIDAVSTAASQQLGDQIAHLNLIIRVSPILLAIAVIFLAAIIKGFVWSRTSKTEFNLNFLSRFLVLNIAWMGIFFVLIYVILTFVKAGLVFAFLLSVLLLFSYFTYGIYSSFMKHQKFSEAFGSVKLSFRKLHYFIVPFIAAIILWGLSIWLSTITRLDGVLFALVVRLYNFGGLYPSSVLIMGPLIPPVGILMATMASVLANPLLRIVTAFSRYYYDSLVSEIRKK